MSLHTRLRSQRKSNLPTLNPLTNRTVDSFNSPSAETIQSPPEPPKITNSKSRNHISEKKNSLQPKRGDSINIYKTGDQTDYLPILKFKKKQRYNIEFENGMHARNTTNISSLVMVKSESRRPKRQYSIADPQQKRMHYDIEAQNRLAKLCENLSPMRQSLSKKSSKESVLSNKGPAKGKWAQRSKLYSTVNADGQRVFN